VDTETQVNQLGIPWGDAKHLLKWRKAIGVGQVELASAAGVSHQLISFIETGTQTFTESAQFKLWGAIMRLGFERAKKGNGASLADWQRVLIALSEIEGKKRAERTERWEKLQAEAAARNRDSLWGGYLFLSWPENEAEMQRIVEEGQSSLELSKLIGAQVDELLPHLKKDALEDIRKNPEKILEEYSALWAAVNEDTNKRRDLEAQGYALFLNSDVEAKDKRIAELEEELRALKAKEQSND
jgi:transcriptional regulator with XRE-family HTH domain